MIKHADSPGVSVVLPVLFRHVSALQTELLRSAVESVLDQGYSGPMELVVVDDGSPRPVEALAGELGAASSRIRWLRLPKNQGIVGALNAGIAAAKHPLIARMDADDQWLDGKLNAQIGQFNADPDLTISATGMVRVDTDGAKIDTYIRPGSWEGILRFFVEGGCPFPHGSVVADKRVFQILGGYPHAADLRHCEDYSLWGVWLRFFKPAMIEQALYSYRVSGGSVSSEHAEQQGRAAQMVRRRFEALNAASVVPQALPALAAALGVSLFDAGRLAYHIWHFRAAVRIPEAARAPLAALLPDCVLLAPSGAARPWRDVLGLPDTDTPGGLAVQAQNLG
jgi:glycosyltransferase involved in cell wall biosynthesis